MLFYPSRCHWDLKEEFHSSPIWDKDTDIQEAWASSRTSLHGQHPFTPGGIPALENQLEVKDAFYSWPIADFHCDRYSKQNLE